VPTTAVGLEDRLPIREAEVELVHAAVPGEGEFADEVSDAVCDEQPSGLHLERRSRRTSRVELIEQAACSGNAWSTRSTEPFQV
jgi:hypothetical protein